MNWPSDSRNAISTPLSPLTFGSRGPSLFVPTKIIPPATTGLPYAWEPSSATHLTFFFVFTSQVVGSPFMLETIFRSGVPPHIGQSPEVGSEVAYASEPATRRPDITNKCLVIWSELRIGELVNWWISELVNDRCCCSAATSTIHQSTNSLIHQFTDFYTPLYCRNR